MDLVELQTRLKAMDLYRLPVDGRHGAGTDDALEALLLKEHVGGGAWGDRRREIAGEQIICKLDGIPVGMIDGLMGPSTRHAFEVYDARKANGGRPDPKVEDWRDDENAPPAPAHALPEPSAIPPLPPEVRSKIPQWPRQSGMDSFFGAKGTNQTTLLLPFPMRVAWELDKTVTKWSCNAKCRENFERVWKRTLDHYGIAEIRRLRLDLWGGTLNVRLMRGSATTWSIHSWGCAEDVDPDHNQLKWKRAQASLDNPEYDPFWRFVYDEGAIGLGRERDFDWMHFQFCKL